MNAAACERVAQFVLSYTPEISITCTRNVKTQKLYIVWKRLNYCSIWKRIHCELKQKSSRIFQMKRDIEANEC